MQKDRPPGRVGQGHEPDILDRGLSGINKRDAGLYYCKIEGNKVMKSRACGIMFCYNDEDIIQRSVEFYLSQGVDLVIFDNQSTDTTVDIIRSFYDTQNKYAGQLLDIISFRSEKYEPKAMWRQANDYMHKKLNRYEWIMVIDSDEFYASPVQGLSLLNYLERIKRYGYNIIHGRAYYFFPTKADDCSIADFTKRMNYCKLLNKHPQERIFLYHPSVNIYFFIGHICLRDDRKVCLNPGFILKHYGWISYEQGLKKVFTERLPRYTNEILPQNQYAYMLPVKDHFIKDVHSLMRYDDSKELISEKRFSLMIKIISLYGSVLNRFPKNILPAIMRPYSINPPLADPSPSIIAHVPMKAEAGSRYIFSNIIDRLIPPVLFTKEKYEVDAPSMSYPTTYCFLMTNFCNARCVFCNQPGPSRKAEITLDKFKIMVSHVPMRHAQSIVLSGGGEPLLCRDLFGIIEYINLNFPQIKVAIRTNGLLVGKYAEKLSKLNIDRLEISVHGSEKINNDILQINNSEDVFRGVEVLNGFKKKLNKKIFVGFYPIISHQNIDGLPDLIKRAAELGVDEVGAGCCLYYPHRVGDKLKAGDSVYFHRKRHDAIIKKSIRISRRLNVKFVPTRLFSEKFTATSCRCPWQMMLVDWDGDVYPCPGGEARFYKKVKSGIYHFGNLLHEDVCRFWTNEYYTKLRRQLAVPSEKYIPECDACHLAICFKGPYLKENHIIPEMPSHHDQE